MGARWQCPSSADPGAAERSPSATPAGGWSGPAAPGGRGQVWGGRVAQRRLPLTPAGSCVPGPWHVSRWPAARTEFPAGHRRRAAERLRWNVKDGGDRWSVSIRERSPPWPCPPTLPAGICSRLGGSCRRWDAGAPQPLPPPASRGASRFAGACRVLFWGKRDLGIRFSVCIT